MTQIIIERMECDEHLQDYLFGRYCDRANNFLYDGAYDAPDVDKDAIFFTKNDECTRENICGTKGSRSGRGGRSSCTISDLPILRSIFTNNGQLPKFLNVRPSNENIKASNINTENLPTVTAIPSIFALQHFATNQMSTVDLIVHAIGSHLIGDLGFVDEFGVPRPPPTIPRILLSILGDFPFLSETVGSIFSDGQDPLIHALIRQFFLDNEACGASFPLLCEYFG